MGRKAGISRAAVTEAATAIADREGLAATTLTAVAERLGIRTPSLYNHVDGLSGMRRLLALHAAALLNDTFAAAIEGRRGPARLRAIAAAYRTFARQHPGLYASLLPAPRPGEDDELYDAMAAPALLVADILTESGAAPDDAIHRTRALRSLLHGFVHLEAHGGFGMPVDLDDSFDTAVAAMIAGIDTTAAGGRA